MEYKHHMRTMAGSDSSFSSGLITESVALENSETTQSDTHPVCLLTCESLLPRPSQNTTSAQWNTNTTCVLWPVQPILRSCQIIKTALLWKTPRQLREVHYTPCAF